MKKIQISKIFSLFCYLRTSSISTLVQLLVEYGNYSKKRHIQRCGAYQRGGAYFNENTQRCCACQRTALISDPVLVIVNTVYTLFPPMKLQIFYIFMRVSQCIASMRAFLSTIFPMSRLMFFVSNYAQLNLCTQWKQV